MHCFAVKCLIVWMIRKNVVTNLGVNWKFRRKFRFSCISHSWSTACNLPQARRKSAGKAGCLQLSFHLLIWTCQHGLEHGFPREWIQAEIKSPLTEDYWMDFDWMQRKEQFLASNILSWIDFSHTLPSPSVKIGGHASSHWRKHRMGPNIFC